MKNKLGLWPNNPTASSYQATQQQLSTQLNTQQNNTYQQQAANSYGASQGVGTGGGQVIAGGGGNYSLGSNQPYVPVSTNAGLYPYAEEEVSVPISQELTIGTAKTVLLNILKTSIVPFLWGPPGVGKSSLVKEICQEKGWELIDLRLSLLNPVDLRGLPVLDKKNQQANWYPPSFLPKSGSKPGVLFLDEINLAPLSVQAAAYQLILDKQVGQYKFPNNWLIIAAGNRETDRANVVKISAPLANRFVHLTIQPDFQTWAKWAKNQVRPEVIQFLVMNPQYLFKMPIDQQKAFPSPRSWDFVSQFMTAFDYQLGSPPSNALRTAVAGTVGEAVGELFVKFLTSHNLQDIAARIERFVAGGPLNLPKKKSERYAFISGVVNARQAGKIPEARYQEFLDQLEGEERVTVIKAEHEGLMGADTAYTYLTEPSKKKSELHVDNVSLFNRTGGSAELISQGHRQLISYKKLVIKDKVLQGCYELGSIRPGKPVDEFAAGSIIKPV